VELWFCPCDFGGKGKVLECVLLLLAAKVFMIVAKRKESSRFRAA
jgi:hypothetical protein